MLSLPYETVFYLLIDSLRWEETGNTYVYECVEAIKAAELSSQFREWFNARDCGLHEGAYARRYILNELLDEEEE